MWIIINKFRRLYRVGIWKTIFFNFSMLPIEQAIKLPIIISKNVRFYDLSGRIYLNGIVKPAMIRFGFFGEDNMYWNSEKTLLKISGKITLESDVHFANGIIIRVEKDAHLTIKTNTRISNNVKIICYKEIVINENNRIAWDCQIIDTSFHYIVNKDSKDYGKLNSPIYKNTFFTNYAHFARNKMF